jgi:sporulation protein YlmC with PRC-barrel domain
MKPKFITTIGALALTVPAFAMTAHAANHEDHERQDREPVHMEPEAHERMPHQQHEPGTRERGAMRMHHEEDAERFTEERDRDRDPAMAAHRDPAMAAHHDQAFRSDTVIGQDVVDQQGNDLGTIRDILIDRDGRVAAVLIDAGGVMGIGAETKALEWNRIEVQMGDDGELDRVTTTMSQQELEQLPDFDEGRQQ